MQRSILAVLGATVLIVGAALYGKAHARTMAAPGTAQTVGEGFIFEASNHFSRQPVTVEGSRGINLAAGVASVTLKPAA